MTQKDKFCYIEQVLKQQSHHDIEPRELRYNIEEYGELRLWGIDLRFFGLVICSRRCSALRWCVVSWQLSIEMTLIIVAPYACHWLQTYGCNQVSVPFSRS
jgi:hypothetical protein